jgi:rhodanese-related sulfurtransferase
VDAVAYGLAFCVIALVLFPGCPQEKTPASNIERINTLYLQSKQEFAETPEISAEELLEKTKTGTVVLVDNREREERDVSMIPGAISAQSFESDIEKYADTTVVVYCTIGDRSGHYTKKLRSRGIDAYNLKGGVLAWAHAGGTFVDGHGNTTNRVHVYGAKWNLLPEDYSAVW